MDFCGSYSPSLKQSISGDCDDLVTKLAKGGLIRIASCCKYRAFLRHQIKPIQVHHLMPGGNKVVNEFIVGVIGCIHFRNCA
jgi:hypothetical protein